MPNIPEPMWGLAGVIIGAVFVWLGKRGESASAIALGMINEQGERIKGTEKRIDELRQDLDEVRRELHSEQEWAIGLAHKLKSVVLYLRDALTWRTAHPDIAATMPPLPDAAEIEEILARPKIRDPTAE